jgi:hypothetical protein
VTNLFHAARWKAYLNTLQSHERDNGTEDVDDDPHKVIYHIYHSQKIWFTRDEDNGHGKAARESLEKCGALLDECTTMVDDLEETLANTPKPSTVLDWSQLW